MPIRMVMEVQLLGEKLRGGYTTGACAAAGAKAAAMVLSGLAADDLSEVEITALDGTKLQIPVAGIKKLPEGIQVEIIKDAGDDPDITNGASVFVTLTPVAEKEKLLPVTGKSLLYENVLFEAGRGIGYATKAGLSLAVGEPAINPGPRKLVHDSLQEVWGEKPCRVRIDIPKGEELAGKTLNPVLGIEGGISVIGTTGVLRPMSEEAFKNSLVPQIEVAKAAGYQTQIFVPGKIGERIAFSWGLPQEAMVQTSNFIGFMLEMAADRGLERVLLFGHIGKLAKVAAGVFHTHNRVGDARLEVLAAYSGAAGMPPEGMQRILQAVTTEEALPVIKEYGLEAVYSTIAARASYRAERLLFNRLQVGTVLVTLQGELLGMDARAAEIGREWHWNLPGIAGK